MDDPFFEPLRQQPKPAKFTATLFTGALRPVALDHRAELKPIGEWNKMEVRVRWPVLRVTVNDKLTVVTSLDAENLPSLLGGQTLPRSGRIGLLNWLGTVRYRNIELQELGPAKR